MAEEEDKELKNGFQPLEKKGSYQPRPTQTTDAPGKPPAVKPEDIAKEDKK